MRKHCYRQNLILLRMRLSRCAHTSNKWVFPCMNACIVVVDQVFSDIRFCPNFLVSEPNYVLWPYYQFFHIHSPSQCCDPFGQHRRRSQFWNRECFTWYYLYCSTPNETRRFSLISISAVLGMNALISWLLPSYDLVFDDDGYDGGKAAEKRKKRKEQDYSDDEYGNSRSEVKRGGSRGRENRGEEKGRRREKRTSFSSSDEEGREKRKIEKRERRRSPGNSDENRREKRKKENRERHRSNSSSDGERREKRKRENRERRREASSSEGDGRIERKKNSQAGDYSRSHKVRF